MSLPSAWPYLAVDVIIEREGQVVLIERRFPPHGWALPGGFVELGESVDAAARREALEETGLQVELLEQFHTYSAPARDPRRHTVSVVFLARAAAGATPVAADDAGRAALFPLDALPKLAFDHPQILEDYLRYRQSGQRPPAAR